MPYLLHPISKTELWGVTLLDISLSLFLFVGVLTISTRARTAVIALVLLVLCQALTWTTHALSHHVLIAVGLVLNIVYLVFVGGVILSHVLKNRAVSGETIFAALCVYLLIAFTWAFLYSLLEALQPGAFKINYELFDATVSGRHLFSKLYYFMYLSFTALTTLGVGDIMPASPWARVSMSLEAVVGQLYLVVVISSLVGLRVTQLFQASMRELEKERHGK